jgi:CheY-like chemotaxis protein
MAPPAVRLVTSNNVDVFRMLRSPALTRFSVDYAVATDRDQLLAEVRRMVPQIALVDVELAGGSGYDACRAIKDDPATAATHVVLLVSGRLTRTDLDRIDASGCDDVLAMPLHPDDFYHHLAQLTGLPFRRGRRISVELDLQLPGPAGELTGEVANVGAGGIGVRLPAEIIPGAPIKIRLRNGEQLSPDTSVVVVWCRRYAGPLPWMAGLTFAGDVPVKTRMLLEQVALFDATPIDGGVTVCLHGDFTEVTSFAALAARLAGEHVIDFDVAAVRYISSAGVRAWCQFLAGLEGKQYSFRHCSVAFASQAAMVPMVLGTGTVRSVEAPYLCESCDREELRLLETGAIGHDQGRVIPPKLTCTNCHGDLVFDDVPERYFAFLREE